MSEFISIANNARDLTGQRIGRLVCIGPTSRVRDKSGRSLIVWRCQCDCGKITETRSCNLLSGDTRSCGCLHDETVAHRNTKHGHAKRSGESPEFSTWSQMIARCEQPCMRNFAWYGGRGISVCERWKSSFSNFLEDMGHKPSPDHSLDRIDSNGNYEPNNCRWATKMEQMSNTRRNRFLTAFGETLHMQEWCRRTGIKQRLLWDRLDTGWDVEAALTTPTGARKGRKPDKILVEFDGRRMTLKEWAKEYNMPRNRLAKRLNRGWDMKKALETS